MLSYHNGPRYIRVFLITGALVVAIMVFGGIHGFNAISKLENSYRNVSNTLSTIAALRAINTVVLRANKARQDYFLDESKENYDEFSEAAAGLRSVFVEVMDKVSGIPHQQQRFQKLYSDADTVITQYEYAINAEKAASGEASLSELRQAAEDTELDRIVDSIERLENEERGLLREQSAEALETRKWMQGAIVALSSVSVLFLVFGGLALYFIKRREETFYKEVFALNNELEDKVRVRTMKLKHYSEELQRSNRELQNFAFAASHDLQEPLRKIRAFGDRLNKQYAANLDEKAQDYLRRSLRAAERMSILIEDLLAYSRVSTMARDPESVSLNVILEQAIDNLEYLIEEKGVKIDYPELPVAEVDAIQLTQVFQNLINNSIKFSRPGTAVQVSVRYWDLYESPESEPREFALIFEDNGIGIDPNFSDKIFTMFQRLHGRDEYEGSGIGLAICRRIIERHGGHVSVVPNEGGGAKFLIALPFKQNEVAGHEDGH